MSQGEHINSKTVEEGKQVFSNWCLKNVEQRRNVLPVNVAEGNIGGLLLLLLFQKTWVCVCVSPRRQKHSALRQSTTLPTLGHIRNIKGIKLSFDLLQVFQCLRVEADESSGTEKTVKVTEIAAC